MIQEKLEPILFEAGEVAGAIRSNPTVIKVIGVGGGGCNALNRMIEAGIPDVEFIAVNTDMQCLNMSKASVRIPIGHTVAKGRGSGANPEKGRQAAEEDIDAIKAALEGANMVFITAGMGKGTGTGASPVIARIAKELGALCVAVITRPFAWEGNQVAHRAAHGVAALRNVVDSLIVIANDNIHRVADRKVRFSEAFQLADSVLMNGVRGISHIITTTGQMNADFSDVTRIMCDGRGHALLTMARASGENKVSELLAQVSSNPLQERRDSEVFTIDGARNCLVHISHGPDYGNWENTEIRQGIKDKLHPDAEIISSDLEDPAMTDEVQIVVVATGFEETSRRSEEPGEDDTVNRPPQPEALLVGHASQPDAYSRPRQAVVAEEPSVLLGLGGRTKFIPEDEFIVSEPALLDPKEGRGAPAAVVRGLQAADESLRQTGMAESDIPAYLRKRP